MRSPAPPTAALLVASAALACTRSQPDATSFAVTEPSPATTQTDGTGGSSGSSGPSDISEGGSSTTTGEVSTGAASGTTLVLDVGAAEDLGSLDPPGCKGKIDLLFLVSRHAVMEDVQNRVITAFPSFIATIEEKFADFDYHIMVVDGDDLWGIQYCNTDACAQECGVPGYPCDKLDLVTTCDTVPGAGTVFNAGYLAANEPCDLYGGNRYIIKGQPALPDAFTCIAQVGTSGDDRLMDQLRYALKYALNTPSGCNGGFLRDDALLFIARVANTPDYESEGTPETWAQMIRDAKHGDPKSVVLFAIHPLDWQACLAHPQGRTCRMLEEFPYFVYADAYMDDYGPAFGEAADLVAEACTQFIPG